MCMKNIKKRTKYLNKINKFALCFKWIYSILYYTGALCFQLHTDNLSLTKTNIIYTNFIRIAILMSFFGSMAIKSSGSEGSTAMMQRLSPVLKFILAIESIIISITYTLDSVLMEVNKYKHIQVLQRYQQLDDAMQIDFPYIKWNYHKSEIKYTSFTLFVLIYFYIISFIFLFKVSNCNCDYITTFILALSYVSMTIAPGCRTFLHMGIMDLHRIRYRLLQRLLKQHYACLSAVVDIQYRREIELQLLRLIDYCKNYVEMILHINDLFGIVCGVSVIHDFAILTSLTFLMCQAAVELNPQFINYIYRFLFMIPPLYKLIIYAAYGYATYKEQRNCIHAVKMFENYCGRQSKPIRQQMNAFRHWQMQNSYTFLIGKVTRCSPAILFTTVNTIASSVIILIQLQFQQNSITTHMKEH